MNAPLLCGVLSGWSIALVAIGLFFVMAFALGRREAEYLLFGVLAVAFAAITGASAYGYWATDLEAWRRSALFAHAASAAAVPVHLHFVVRYARAQVTRPVIATYGVSAVFLILCLLDWWWVPGSEVLRTTEIFGYRVTQVSARPLPHAVLYYLFVTATVVAAIVVLLRAYRHGQREALLALLGGVGLLVGAVNDSLSGSAAGIDTVYIIPHAFLLYCYGVAGTLLYRYRSATGELERAASKLQDRTVELRHSYFELDAIEDELAKQQRLAAVGELAASIAHEVRNPLAIIVNATASLRRPHLGEPDREMLLEVIDEETARLNGLVTDLLRFARPLSASRSRVELADLGARAENVAGGRYTIEVVASDDPELDAVPADPGLLGLALDNLVENACQSMPEGGHIRIAARAEMLHGKPYVRLEVSDDGPGMKPDVRQRALDPFFTTRSSGTGLGLPIVKRILEAHDGRVTVDSEPGSGTTIGLLLPRSDAAAAPPATIPLPLRARHRQRSADDEPEPP